MDRGDCTFCDIWRCLQNSAKTENVSQNFYLSPLRMIGSLDCRGQGLTTSRGNTLTITGSHEKSDMETLNWRSREEPGWAGDTETVRLTSQAVMKGIVWFPDYYSWHHLWPGQRQWVWQIASLDLTPPAHHQPGQCGVLMVGEGAILCTDGGVTKRNGDFVTI